MNGVVVESSARSKAAAKRAAAAAAYKAMTAEEKQAFHHEKRQRDMAKLEQKIKKQQEQLAAYKAYEADKAQHAEFLALERRVMAAEEARKAGSTQPPPPLLGGGVGGGRGHGGALARSGSGGLTSAKAAAAAGGSTPAPQSRPPQPQSSAADKDPSSKLVWSGPMAMELFHSDCAITASVANCKTCIPCNRIAHMHEDWARNAELTAPRRHIVAHCHLLPYECPWSHIHRCLPAPLATRVLRAGDQTAEENRVRKERV